MRSIILLSLMISAFFSEAQVLKLTGSIGYSTIETPQYKKIVLYTERVVNYEFTSHRKLYLLAGIGTGNLQFNAINSQGDESFIKMQLLSFPVTVRKYEYLKNESFFFFDIGMMGNYFFKQKEETKVTGENIKQENLGLTMGISGGAGYKRMMTGKIGIEISFNVQIDCFSSFSNKKNEISNNKKMISLGISKKFGK